MNWPSSIVTGKLRISAEYNNQLIADTIVSGAPLHLVPVQRNGAQAVSCIRTNRPESRRPASKTHFGLVDLATKGSRLSATIGPHVTDDGKAGELLDRGVAAGSRVQANLVLRPGPGTRRK